MKHKNKAFSLIELLISLIIISLIASAFAPIVSKKIHRGNISLQSTEQITSECKNSTNYGEKCELCTKKYCIKCGLDNCAADEYANTKTCRCAPCTDWSNACLECNSSGCTRCNNTPMRYVLNGKCELCPSGHYCDGATDYATCPNENGYYCDNSGIHKCTAKYGAGCKKCTASSCLECADHYGKIGTTCTNCGASCIKCSKVGTCDICNDDWARNATTQTCAGVCRSFLSNCVYCSGNIRGTDNSDLYTLKCTKCSAGYYVSNGRCVSCSKANCSQCADNTGVCTACKGGYYFRGGQCFSCKEKFGTNCAACNNNECLSCNSGWHLDSSKTCVQNDGNFSCSDSNFMQIGNLCVTRKNMGDSPVLYIPSEVIKANPGENCYALTQKCCWVGVNFSHYTSYGNYSGNKRTICNHQAAESICSNFNYADKKWRLPAKEEMANWLVNSQGLDSNGLMVCELTSSASSELAACNDTYGPCSGASLNACYPTLIWGKETDSFNASASSVYMGKPNLPSTVTKTSAGSVRCVTEME